MYNLSRIWNAKSGRPSEEYLSGMEFAQSTPCIALDRLGQSEVFVGMDRAKEKTKNLEGASFMQGLEWVGSFFGYMLFVFL